MLSIGRNYEPSRAAGDSANLHALPPASRAQSQFRSRSWGLRPRLYAVARSAGFGAACFAGSALAARRMHQIAHHSI